MKDDVAWSDVAWNFVYMRLRCDEEWRGKGWRGVCGVCGMRAACVRRGLAWGEMVWCVWHDWRVARLACVAWRGVARLGGMAPRMAKMRVSAPHRVSLTRSPILLFKLSRRRRPDPSFSSNTAISFWSIRFRKSRERV